MKFYNIRVGVLSSLIVLSFFSTTSVVADEGGASKLSALFGTFANSLAEAAEASKQRAAARRGEQPQVGSADQQKTLWLNTNPMSNMSDADKQLMAKGMWHDPKTGLIWMRCVLGEEWNGTGCTENLYGTSFVGNDAAEQVSQKKFGGYSDWRIPTIADLYGLYDFSSCETNGLTTNAVSIPTNGNSGVINASTDCKARMNTITLNPSIFLVTRKSSDTEGLKFLSASYTCTTTHEDPNYDKETHSLSQWKINFSGDFQVVDCVHARDFSLTSGSYGHVLVVRGGTSTGEFENALAIAQRNKADIQQSQATAKVQIAKHDAILRQQQAVRNSRVTAFQKSVHVGDHSVQGIVIEVRGDVIRVQATDYICLELNSNGSCIHRGTQLVEKWIPRNAILPI